MKKLFLISLVLSWTQLIYAQYMGINNMDPQVSLDITGGIAHRSIVLNPFANNINLPPNVSHIIIGGEGATDLITLFDAEEYVDGRRLVIYNNSGFTVYFSNHNINVGETREFICRSPGGWSYIGGDDFVPVGGWQLYGNTETNPSYHFIGTADEAGLKIKTHNYDRIEITSDGRTGINGPPGLDNKVEIKNTDLYTTLNVKNTRDEIIYNPATETHAISATHSGDYGTRIAGKFVANGGYSGFGQNIGINVQVMDNDAITPGIGILAESIGYGSIAGKFKAVGTSALSGYFESGDVLINQRLGINITPGSNTRLIVNNNNSVSAAQFLTDWSSFQNIMGLDIKVKNPGQGGATGIYIDADDSPTDFAIIADGHSILNGRVSVGTANPALGYMLSVDGKVIAEELRVQNSTAWPDYVFESGYELMNLNTLSEYLKINKHLPDVPPAAQIESNGIMVGEMQSVLLKKIEELTLYIIEQNERIQKLEAKLSVNEK